MAAAAGAMLGPLQRSKRGLEQSGDLDIAVSQLEQAGTRAPVTDALRARMHGWIGSIATGEQRPAIGERMRLRIDGGVERLAERQRRDDLPVQGTSRRGGQLVHTMGKQRVQPRRLDRQRRRRRALRGQARLNLGEDARERGSDE